MNSNILPIGEICSPFFKGMIGVLPYPGKMQGLEGDLDRLKKWGADYLITFVEDRELLDLGINDIALKSKDRGLIWHHLPIGDMGCPDDSFQQLWAKISTDLHQCLKAGGRVALHCKGGFGRSGSIAAQLLIEAGHTSDEAILLVRKGRGPEAIETKSQEDYLHKLSK